jgi:hypothetical protein
MATSPNQFYQVKYLQRRPLGMAVRKVLNWAVVTGTVLILYSTGPWSQVLCSYCTQLGRGHRYCTHTALILYACCTPTVCVLHSHCTRTVLTPHYTHHLAPHSGIP